MPFALVIIGLVMIVSGARDTHRELGAELVSDFTGDANFTYWLVSIGAVGALGYIPQFRGFSRGFMALILVAMVIRNGGVFDKFTEALAQGPEVVKAPAGDDAKDVTSLSSVIRNLGPEAAEAVRDRTGDDLGFGFKSGDAKGNAAQAFEYFLKFFA